MSFGLRNNRQNYFMTSIKDIVNTKPAIYCLCKLLTKVSIHRTVVYYDYR